MKELKFALRVVVSIIAGTLLSLAGKNLYNIVPLAIQYEFAAISGVIMVCTILYINFILDKLLKNIQI